MQIFFWNGSIQCALLGKEISEGIDEFLKTGDFVLGSWVKRLEREFASLPDFELSVKKGVARQVYWVHTSRIKRREILQRDLVPKSIVSRILYAISTLFQKAFEYITPQRGNFQVSERYSDGTISIGMFP